MQKVVVWWLKRDLRLADNQALQAAMNRAAEMQCPLIALWITEPEAYAAPEYHPRRERFVLECLADLEPELRRLNVCLWIAEGSALHIFRILSERGLIQVFSHEETGVLWTFSRDIELKKFFKSKGVMWSEFPTNGVVRGLKDRALWQGTFQARLAQPLISRPVNPHPFHLSDNSFQAREGRDKARFLRWEERGDSLLFAEARLAPKNQQRGGEAVAHGLLRRFMSPEIHGKYLFSLAKPHDAQFFSSRLSPYLAFGCLTSRQIFSALDNSSNQIDSRSLSAFRSRLAWRCHFIQKLENFPDMEMREQNPALAELRPEMSAEEQERWLHGLTGFPLVDACLRSVHQTGFLNFRMRAMLMSFSTHLMWRDWRTPAWDLASSFLDFEPGIHFSQVHMQSAVTGNNQIRIYNPLKQSEENDKDARFIKHWIPELRAVEPGVIHAGVGLPANYPAPLVELKTAMAHARQELFNRFKAADVRAEAKLVQEKLGSRSRPQSRKRKNVKKVREAKTLFDED
ncbi:hypothetical protein EBU99_12085 [bacterium]|nr:hypothetical protein [bacterium]